MKEICIWWIRRDLRLEDNAALFAAHSSGLPVLPVFIFDTSILDSLPSRQDARLDFIYERLGRLNEDLHNIGSTIQTYHGEPTEIFEKIIADYNPKAVFANEDYEPYARQRDKKVADILNKAGISFELLKDQVIFSKNEILKPDGQPYTVFTPYSRTWLSAFEKSRPVAYPTNLQTVNFLKAKARKLPSLSHLGFTESGTEIPPVDLGERLIRNYHKTRNDLSAKGTTQLGIHLRFGTISIRYLAAKAYEWNPVWLSELIWREFFMMILYHYPRVQSENFRRKFDAMPWRNDEREFEQWCAGETGYPMVDAGMRQLNETGWMHNRVRMVTASFLTKHLLIDWRWGEAYFAGKLLDYELASNNGNWQWAAGTGCDSAPYFRIFNPELQQKKFDPQEKYIRKWIPDYRPDYAKKIIDHAEARKRALAAFESLTD